MGDEPVSLTAIIEPANATDRSVTWSSNHPEIVSVSVEGGVITAVAPGQAVITAKTVDGGFENTCTVTVKDNVISLIGIAFEQEEYKVAVSGDPLTLVPVFTPANATDKTLWWESDDEDTATVEDGVVTAVAEGSTTIRAISNDGDHEAECTVNVGIGVESVRWLTSPVQAVTGESFRIDQRVVITPAEATNKKVTFRCSDETKLTIADPDAQGYVYVTPLGMGEVIITVKTDDGGHEAEMTVQIVK
jgi:uncharacterized protein YjdB